MLALKLIMKFYRNLFERKAGGKLQKSAACQTFFMLFLLFLSSSGNTGATPFWSAKGNHSSARLLVQSVKLDVYNRRDKITVGVCVDQNGHLFSSDSVEILPEIITIGAYIHPKSIRIKSWSKELNHGKNKKTFNHAVGVSIVPYVIVKDKKLPFRMNQNRSAYYRACLSSGSAPNKAYLYPSVLLYPDDKKDQAELKIILQQAMNAGVSLELLAKPVQIERSRIWRMDDLLARMLMAANQGTDKLHFLHQLKIPFDIEFKPKGFGKLSTIGADTVSSRNISSPLQTIRYDAYAVSVNIAGEGLRALEQKLLAKESTDDLSPYLRLLGSDCDQIIRTADGKYRADCNKSPFVLRINGYTDITETANNHFDVGKDKLLPKILIGKTDPVFQFQIGSQKRNNKRSYWLPEEFIGLDKTILFTAKGCDDVKFDVIDLLKSDSLFPAEGYIFKPACHPSVPVAVEIPNLSPPESQCMGKRKLILVAQAKGLDSKSRRIRKGIFRIAKKLIAMQKQGKIIPSFVLHSIRPDRTLSEPLLSCEKLTASPKDNKWENSIGNLVYSVSFNTPIQYLEMVSSAYPASNLEAVFYFTDNGQNRLEKTVPAADDIKIPKYWHERKIKLWIHVSGTEKACEPWNNHAFADFCAPLEGAGQIEASLCQFLGIQCDTPAVKPLRSIFRGTGDSHSDTGLLLQPIKRKPPAGKELTVKWAAHLPQKIKTWLTVKDYYNEEAKNISFSAGCESPVDPSHQGGIYNVSQNSDSYIFSGCGRFTGLTIKIKGFAPIEFTQQQLADGAVTLDAGNLKPLIKARPTGTRSYTFGRKNIPSDTSTPITLGFNNINRTLVFKRRDGVCAVRKKLTWNDILTSYDTEISLGYTNCLSAEAYQIPQSWGKPVSNTCVHLYSRVDGDFLSLTCRYRPSAQNVELDWGPAWEKHTVNTANPVIRRSAQIEFRPRQPFASNDPWRQGQPADTGASACEQMPRYEITRVRYKHGGYTKLSPDSLTMQQHRMPSLQEMDWPDNYSLPDSAKLTLQQTGNAIRYKKEATISFPLSAAMEYDMTLQTNFVSALVNNDNKASIAVQETDDFSYNSLYNVYQYSSLENCKQHKDGIQHGYYDENVRLEINKCSYLRLRNDVSNAWASRRCKQIKQSGSVTFEPYACPGKRRLIVVAQDESLDKNARKINRALVNAINELKKRDMDKIPAFSLHTLIPDKRLSKAIISCEQIRDSMHDKSWENDIMNLIYSDHFQPMKDLALVSNAYRTGLHSVFYFTDNGNNTLENLGYLDANRRAVPLAWHTDAIKLWVAASGRQTEETVCKPWKQVLVDEDHCQVIKGRSQIEVFLDEFLTAD